MGTDQGIRPWVRALVIGRSWWEAFWVGCGCFFWTTRVSEQFFFMLYILYWALGFCWIKFQSITKSALDLDALGGHVRCSSVDNSTTSSTRRGQLWRGCCTSFHHWLQGAVGMVSYAHVVYVTCYFCYMFSLGSSSGSSDRVRIYRRVIFGKQNWWCARTPCT
jgi:hypothetical protein